MVAKEAVYLAIVIRLDGSKEMLGYMIAPTEFVHVWRELLEDCKDRGMEDILLCISDGLKGMESMLSEVYPHTRDQTYLVHVQRNLSHKLRTKDLVEMSLISDIFQPFSDSVMMQIFSSLAHQKVLTGRKFRCCSFSLNIRSNDFQNIGSALRAFSHLSR